MAFLVIFALFLVSLFFSLFAVSHAKSEEFYDTSKAQNI